MESYSSISQNIVTSKKPNQKIKDPTLYLGSGGVVFALQKICTFIKSTQRTSTQMEQEETKSEEKKEFTFEEIYTKY